MIYADCNYSAVIRALGCESLHVSSERALSCFVLPAISAAAPRDSGSTWTDEGGSVGFSP